jgi:uncharacterized glyoxalase superfamily protein PhnB
MTKCVPFIRVPDIAATIKWYENIDINCTGTNLLWEPDGELNWAEMNFQGATFMLYPEEHEKPLSNRDAGLYFEMEKIDGFSEKLQGRVKVIEETEKTFYGRKEIVFEDLNGYMITFSCRPAKID